MIPLTRSSSHSWRGLSSHPLAVLFTSDGHTSWRSLFRRLARTGNGSGPHSAASHGSGVDPEPGGVESRPLPRSDPSEGSIDRVMTHAAPATSFVEFAQVTEGAWREHAGRKEARDRGVFEISASAWTCAPGRSHESAPSYAFTPGAR